MKKILLTALAGAMMACGGSENNQYADFRPEPTQTDSDSASVVYFTEEISPESLVRVFDALGAEAEGKVCVKISIGEAGGDNYLKPELIGCLIKKVNGTIVECNTSYPGSRNTTSMHLKVAESHGFTNIADVDIMDSDGEFKIPVKDTTWIKYDLVGDHMKNYDFMINLAHFKGHAMGGFGGVLKNASIGVASQNGKAYIHTAGKVDSKWRLWFNLPDNNDDFTESMASAAQAVHDYFNDTKNGVVYINVMNNLSVDCDCDFHPAKPMLKDRGIMASTDPVALDKACLDLIFAITPSDGDDSRPLIERINSRHGTHIVDHAAKIGLGKLEYKLVRLE